MHTYINTNTHIFSVKGVWTSLDKTSSHKDVNTHVEVQNVCAQLRAVDVITCTYLFVHPKL